MPDFYLKVIFEKKTKELTKWHSLLQRRGVCHKLSLQSPNFHTVSTKEYRNRTSESLD